MPDAVWGHKLKTSPTRTFAEYFWTLKNRHKFAPSLCITVGTDGGNALTPMCAAFGDAFHLVVEHNKDDAALAKTALKKMQGKSVHAAALEQAGTVAPSAEGKINLLQASIGAKSAKAADAVKVVTLDALVDKLDTKGPSVIKVDYRGAELRVLGGASETLLSCEVVIIKVALHKLWGDNHPEFSQVIKFMKDQGFAAHDFLNGLFRPADRALGVIDVAFVREDGVIRGSRHWRK